MNRGESYCQKRIS